MLLLAFYLIDYKGQLTAARLFFMEQEAKYPIEVVEEASALVHAGKVPDQEYPPPAQIPDKPKRFAMNEKTGLDATDIRILSAVQQHGQLSKVRLAEIVNLSPTPCWARLGKLTAAGYIRGYHADIALNRLIDFTQVIVTVALTDHRKSDFDRFEAHIRQRDEITECSATGGGMDYVLKVFSHNLSAFQELMDSLLTAELGIKRYMTYIVIREVKAKPPNRCV